MYAVIANSLMEFLYAAFFSSTHFCLVFVMLSHESMIGCVFFDNVLILAHKFHGLLPPRLLF